MSNDKELIALLKEARRIIRTSLSRGLYQDWDRRATAALAVAREDKPVQYAWECNQCGAQEYSMSVSADDVQNLGCGKCGGDEWHKEVAQ